MTDLEKKQDEFIKYLLKYAGTSKRIENFISEIAALKEQEYPCENCELSDEDRVRKMMGTNHENGDDI